MGSAQCDPWPRFPSSAVSDQRDDPAQGAKPLVLLRLAPLWPRLFPAGRGPSHRLTPRCGSDPARAAGPGSVTPLFIVMNNWRVLIPYTQTFQLDLAGERRGRRSADSSVHRAWSCSSSHNNRFTQTVVFAKGVYGNLREQLCHGFIPPSSVLQETGQEDVTCTRMDPQGRCLCQR